MKRYAAAVPDSDEALLDAWREGDNDAGTELFRQYFVPCRRFFVNKVPEGDVDDLLQRTFTALVESRDRYRKEAPFRSFLFSVARRVLLRHLRDFARKGSKRAIDFNVSSLADLAVTPRTTIALQRDHESVRVALQKIPVHYQMILELSYWEGVSNAELAEVMEIDPTTVRTRLFRARKALLTALDGTGVAEDRVEEAAASLGSRL